MIRIVIGFLVFALLLIVFEWIRNAFFRTDSDAGVLMPDDYRALRSGNFIVPPKMYFREADGHTYWIEDSILYAAPTFINDEVDIENKTAVGDFDKPLHPEEWHEIISHLEEANETSVHGH